MNLVRAELLRLVSRRFCQVLLVILVAAFGVTFATTVATTHRPTAAEVAAAELQAETSRADTARFYQQCIESATSSGDAGRVLERCGPPPTPIGVEAFLNNVFVFANQIPSLLYFLAAFLAMFGFLVGASFVGAEMTSGGMTNLLLWRPDRVRVLGTKLGVLLGTVLVTAVAGSVLYVGTFWALAETAGLPGNLDSTFWGQVVLLIARLIGFALLTTAIGFGLATLGRHTAAALGVAAGYLVVWELGARIVLSVIRSPLPDRWMLSTYAVAWMRGETTVYELACESFDDCTTVLTQGHAVAVFAAVLAVVVGGAFAVFRKRDLV